MKRKSAPFEFVIRKVNEKIKTNEDNIEKLIIDTYLIDDIKNIDKKLDNLEDILKEIENLNNLTLSRLENLNKLLENIEKQISNIKSSNDNKINDIKTKLDKLIEAIHKTANDFLSNIKNVNYKKISEFPHLRLSRNINYLLLTSKPRASKSNKNNLNIFTKLLNLIKSIFGK